MAVKKTEPERIDLQRIEDAIAQVPIVGLTPVIPHKWSEKSLGMMRDKQFGKAKQKPAPKDPLEEALAASYWIKQPLDPEDAATGEPGIPATAFKAAIADAARYFDGVTITDLKQIIYVDGVDVGGDLLVPFSGIPVLREDTPRNSGGTCDLRYRYAWSEWRATLTVRYVPRKVTSESVIALVDAAGRGGVGDWRPSSPKSKTGIYGTWRIDA